MRLLFKSSRVHREFYDVVHPDLRAKTGEFCNWCDAEGLPIPVITRIYSTEEENAALGGVPNSDHLWAMAIDFRNRNWSAEQRARGEGWFRDNCDLGKYQLVLKDHGTAPHWHIGRRDEVWKMRFVPPLTDKDVTPSIRGPHPRDDKP